MGTQMLRYDPKDRISAEEVLQHEWMKTYKDPDIYEKLLQEQGKEESDPTLDLGNDARSKGRRWSTCKRTSGDSSSTKNKLQMDEGNFSTVGSVRQVLDGLRHEDGSVARSSLDVYRLPRACVPEVPVDETW